jgi:multidrug transporter EmrE-like cation transporter
MNLFISAGALIISYLMMLTHRQKVFKMIKCQYKNIELFILSMCKYMWLFLYFPVAKQMNLGVLEAITVSSTALVILGGRIILKEKVTVLAYILISLILACTIATNVTPSPNKNLIDKHFKQYYWYYTTKLY